MSLKHKSQSALEYMMTYGWAILVIVIVAAVLYSLGIFSPSSSLSTTVTGFSSFSVNGICLNNGAMKISLQNGVGYEINLYNLTASSSYGNFNITGVSYSVLPSGFMDLVLIGVCPTSTGVSYSVSLKLFYTEPGQVFPGPYETTGTVTGTSGSIPKNQWIVTGYELSNPFDFSAFNSSPLYTPGVGEEVVALGDWNSTNSSSSEYGKGYAFTSSGYSGNSFGFSIQPMPGPLSVIYYSCSSNELCQGASAYSLQNLSGNYNISITTDDAMDVFYRLIGTSEWHNVFDGSAWHGQGATPYSKIVDFPTGVYQIIAAWNNGGGGPGMTALSIDPT